MAILTRKEACPTCLGESQGKWEAPPRLTRRWPPQCSCRRNSRKSLIRTRTLMRSRRDPLTRREFAQLLGGGALAFSFPRAFAAAAAVGPILFQDAATASGLDFALRNDAKGRKYQVETVLGGLGVIDFDQDGWPDLYCVNGASLPFLQRSDPSFLNR